MKNIMLSVFNEQGNFADTIELKEDVQPSEVARILAPHVVSEGAQADTMTVRPMRGLSMNADEFYRLVKATLNNAGIIADRGSLTTGYGNYVMTADMGKEDGDSFPSALLSIVEESTGKVVHSICINTGGRGVVSARECADYAINRLVSDQQALTTLINTGVEYLATKFKEWADSEDTAGTETDSAEVAPKIPPRPRVQQDSPRLAEELSKVQNLPSKHEVRQKVKEMIDDVKETRADRERFMVTIPVKIEGRNVTDVAVEVDRTNLERIGAEGVLTTICQFLAATIQENRLYIPESNGFLMKVRNAFDDHGIVTISITPRSSSFSNDNGEVDDSISILDM